MSLTLSNSKDKFDFIQIQIVTALDIHLEPMIHKYIPYPHSIL